MLPTFYILGAQKAGTTWLAAMLRQHPDIFIPRQKELHFFNDEARYARGPAWYARQFAGAHAARAIGEATPNYLAINTPKAQRVSERIRALTPDATFIVALRNPVSRALSAMFHAARKRRIPFWTNFDRALQDILSHHVDPSDVLSIGRYDVQLESYFRSFPRERFHILVYEEDIVKRKAETLDNLWQFLGVGAPPLLRHQTRLFNVGIKSRLGLAFAQLLPWKWGVAMARTVEHAGLGRQITLSEETTAALFAYYEKTRGRVEALIGRDLSCWRVRPQTSGCTAASANPFGSPKHQVEAARAKATVAPR
ncbi:MAG TPA: sulfotransferase [Opitutaceae bacterium]